MKKTILTIAIIIAAAFLAEGQDITVTARTDTSVILIGDQIYFTVTALVPPERDVMLQTLSDTLSGKIVILGKPDRDTLTKADGASEITDRYLITSFDSGTYIIPPFYAESSGRDSLLRYYSDYTNLRVMRPDITPPDTTDVIFDIVPPRKAPLTFRETIPWLIIAAVMAVVIWLLIRYLPRTPLRKIIRTAVPAEPAHVIALRELERLRQDEVWQKGEVKEYYSRLSDILRRYVDGRFGIMSPELTTDETIRMLQKANVLGQSELAQIKEILSLSDMVKFAKYLPLNEVNERMFTDSLMFVELTREPDVKPEDKAEKKGGADE